MNESEWLDAMAVSRMLCVERSTVWHYASTGRLPADGRMFDRPVWHVATVRAYIAGMSEQGRRRYEQRKARAAEDAA